MSLGRALLLGLLLALYLRSPIDLVPDRLGGIGLLDDLLLLVAAAWWAARRLSRRGARPAPEPPAGDGPWDPYAVLGVARSASPAEVTQAYREQLKRYHPDRVADLGEDLQRLAHEKTLALQRAYAEIGGS
jgi:DnaJ-domain-containing protein 1